MARCARCLPSPAKKRPEQVEPRKLPSSAKCPQIWIRGSRDQNLKTAQLYIYILSITFPSRRSTDGRDAQKNTKSIEEKKLKKRCAPVVAALALAGCAQLPPARPLAIDQAKRLQGQSVARTKAETPSFVAMTAAKGGFAVLGVMAAISEGNELVKTNGVEDPAVKISGALTSSLAEKYHLELKPAAGESIGEPIEQIVGAAPSADVILDVRTLGWRIGYFPASWGTYYVAYAARARLVDVKTKAVIAESICATPRPEKTEKSPSYDALMGNAARGLKQELTSIADQCVGKFKVDMQL